MARSSFESGLLNGEDAWGVSLNFRKMKAANHPAAVVFFDGMAEGLRRRHRVELARCRTAEEFAASWLLGPGISN